MFCRYEVDTANLKHTERLSECKAKGVLGVGPGKGRFLVFVAGGGQKRGDLGDVFEADQVGYGCAGVDGGDIFKGFVNSPGADAQLLNRVLNGPNLIFDLLHQAAIGFELFFGAGEDAPDLVPFLLDGEGVEAHLEAGKDSHEG